MDGLNQNSQLLIYQSPDGAIKIDVRLEDETVWLTLNQMAELFQIDKSGVSRHLKNIFESGELARDSVVAKIATTAADGKTYQVEYYSLDAIIQHNGRALLTHVGNISHEMAHEKAVIKFSQSADMKKFGNSEFYTKQTSFCNMAEDMACRKFRHITLNGYNLCNITILTD